MVALVFLLLLVMAAVLAPVLAPFDPDVQDLRATLLDPSREHVLGTDELGRDQFSRLLFAGRISLSAVLIAVTIGMVIGVPLGLMAGYVGGWVDSALSRLIDAFMSLPPIILAIAIVGVLGPGLRNAMAAVGVIFAPRFARLVRGAVLDLRSQEFLDAAVTVGLRTRQIVVRHVLPNIAGPLVVQTSISAGVAMLAEASLSFLGLGVQPPQASWGAMIGRAVRHLDQHPTLVLAPGLAIAAAVLAFNVVGDGLRDAVGRDYRELERS